jgi:histidinol-phosphatase
MPDRCSLSAQELDALLALAIEATHVAAPIILGGFRNPSLTFKRKSDGSIVTPLDVEAERRIRAFIEAHQAQPFAFLGEELGELVTDLPTESSAAHYRWVIDPIDGTLLFARGLTGFGTLLALEERASARSVLGVIHLPALGETYSAARGRGAWCGAQRLRVAPERPWSDCLISLPVADHARLVRAGGPLPHVRSYGDCVAHAMVARGALDALAEPNLARWDIAATEVIVEEAGGTVLIRDHAGTADRYDCILGSPRAAADLAQRLGA